MADEAIVGKASKSIFRTPCGLSIAHVAKAETTFAYKEIFEDKIYFQHGIEVRDGDCVFDVGANIGLFTIFVQERYRDVTSFSFEPSPEVFPLLQLNIAKYGSRARAYPFGLADEERQATFTYYPAYSIMSGFHASDVDNRIAARAVILNQWHERFPQQEDPEERFLEELVDGILNRKTEYPCRLRRLSDVFRETGVAEISLLKIDAEGSESEILAGIDPADWPRIRQMVLEVHDPDHTRGPAIRDLLESKHYECVSREEAQFRSTGISNCYARRRC